MIWGGIVWQFRGGKVNIKVNIIPPTEATAYTNAIEASFYLPIIKPTYVMKRNFMPPLRGSVAE